MYISPENKFDNDDEDNLKPFANQIFQYCIRHNYLNAETGLQYNKEGEVCEQLKFMVKTGIHQNDKYILTKRLYDLTRNIYFQPVTKPDSFVYDLVK